MTTPQRTPSLESTSGSEGNIRKRVCKACDRCRLKKSKCDGASPCSRCKADNAICVFGERKKSHDKVYPKGYVEMLEQQQAQLVAGLRELYSRLQTGQGWPGAPLQEAQGGHPLTHDILERLNLLQPASESGEGFEVFEENCQRMQQKLLENGASFTSRRRGSVSSESEHDHTSTSSTHGTPPMKSLSSFSEPFPRSMAPPTPPSGSPFPQASPLHTAKIQMQQPPLFQQSPLSRTAALNPQTLLRSNWAPEPLAIDDGSTPPLEYLSQYDAPMFDVTSMQQYDQFAMAPATVGLSNGANPTYLMEWTEPNSLDFDYMDQMRA